jgi:hypothetical protein
VTRFDEGRDPFRYMRVMAWDLIHALDLRCCSFIALRVLFEGFPFVCALTVAEGVPRWAGLL